MLIHPDFGVFNRTADPGYVLSEMEKHHVGEQEPELKQHESSQARKKPMRS
jgi:hypothetical protein